MIEPGEIPQEVQLKVLPDVTFYKFFAGSSGEEGSYSSFTSRLSAIVAEDEGLEVEERERIMRALEWSNSHAYDLVREHLIDRSQSFLLEAETAPGGRLKISAKEMMGLWYQMMAKARPDYLRRNEYTALERWFNQTPTGVFVQIKDDKIKISPEIDLTGMGLLKGCFTVVTE